MLEPDRLQRPDAIRFVNTLYDQRSKALHGESVETEKDDAEKVRRLAAAVLHAVVEWQDYQERMGDTSERKDFLDELKSSEQTGGLMVGVPEDLAKFVRQP